MSMSKELTDKQQAWKDHRDENKCDDQTETMPENWEPQDTVPPRE